MFSIERRIMNWIIRHRAAVLIAVATCMGALIRFSMLKAASSDMKEFLLPWFSEIRANGGLRGMSVQVGNYNVAYQFIIALMTYLPFPPKIMYKAVSIFFDYMLAICVGKFAVDVGGKKDAERFAFAYSLTLLLPTVFLNSAAWGQCDSIYTTFCVICLDQLYLNSKKPSRGRAAFAFLMLGFAFAMKFQTIIILPFVGYLYFLNGGFSLLNGLIPTLLNMAIPAALGRGLLDTFKVYLGQANTYKDSMTLNAPSIWLFFSQRPGGFMPAVAIALTLAALGLGLVLLLKKPEFIHDRKNFAWVLLWSCWTCVMILPSMHERYGYIVEVLLVAMTLFDLSLFPFAACMELCSMTTYGYFLMHSFMFDSVRPVAMIACVAAYIAFSGMLLWKVRNYRICRE